MMCTLPNQIKELRGNPLGEGDQFMHNRMMLLGAVVLGAMIWTSSPARADETRVVLQISDAAPEKQALVLNVASNLLNAFGPDNVKLEVVAFGPGLKLLFADNRNRDRVQSLAAYGVKFDACENTLAAMTKQLGYRPRLDPDATPVAAGIVQIVRLTQAGYTLVRP